MKILGEIQRSLTPELDDDRLRRLRRYHIEHILGGERLEIQPVRGVVVGRDGLGVAVDHDRLVARVAQGEGGVHAAIVELDSLADPVWPRSEDHDPRPFGRPDLVLFLEGPIHVWGLRLEFGCARVHGLVGPQHTRRSPEGANLTLGLAPEVRNLGVGEPVALCLVHEVRIRRLLELMSHLDDLCHLIYEPGIDRRQRGHLFDAPTPPQCLSDGEYPIRGWLFHGVSQPVVREVPEVLLGAIGVEPPTSALEAPEGLLKRLGKRASYRHCLAHASHRGGQSPWCRWELGEIESRGLHDHVIEGRFEGGGCGSGDVVGYLIEGHADGQQGSDLGDGESGCLRSQCRRSAHPRVHLDDESTSRFGVDGELNVRPARFDTDRLQHLYAFVAHFLVLAVGQGLNRGDGDRVTRVNTHGIEILDGANDDCVAGLVAHHLELVFLPAQDRLFDEDLPHGGEFETVTGFFEKLLLVVGNPCAAATENERRSDHQRIADIGGDPERFGHRPGVPGPRHLHPHTLHRLLEEPAILRLVDGLQVGSDHLHAMAVEYTGPSEVACNIQGRLASQSGEKGVRPLPGDDLGHDLFGYRLYVRGVGKLGVCHDRGRIRVDEDHLVAMGAQNLRRLSARVVELTGLADDDRPGADDQNAFNVGAFWHDSLRCRC